MSRVRGSSPMVHRSEPTRMSFHASCPFLALSIVAAIGACDPAPELADDLEFRETGWGCATCQTNSPRVNDAPIAQVRLSGAENDQGVRMLGLRPTANGPLHAVTTDDNEDLVAVLNGVTVTSGAGLVGWELVFEYKSTTHVAHISAHNNNILSFTDAGRPMSAYAINFPIPQSTQLQNICPTYLNDPLFPVVTVIRGETYDTEKKLVDSVDPDWITFACADEAAYKTKRLGYGPMSAFGPSTPAVGIAERNATLKMITADYCGTGVSFTEQGQPLWVEDVSDLVNVPPGVDNWSEAVWTADGALCLDTPRFAERSDVIADCPLPTCDTIDLQQPGIVWISGAPPN